MYDVSGFRPNNEKTATLILIVTVLLVVVFGVGYMLGLRAGTDVSDHGNGIDDIREQYQHIKVSQHEITNGIREATGTGGAIAESSRAIETTAGAIAGGVNESGRLIDECQQIIGTVRNRGKK